VRGVTDLMVMPGLITSIRRYPHRHERDGKAMMGTGEAEGERRAIDAAESRRSRPAARGTCR